ncbi:hypothetical protein Tcan_10062 [Toxocara canis]|uniref:Uncharacterized protein n=2 Tax=Toxocara canis TaxID=6265 RepID=A0A0B2VXV3_TOXCA|nr:hypothetical protein Tcan_10062 [Toxocara canis]VDM45212.1 unnamed protein product [Toxocara canis]
MRRHIVWIDMGSNSVRNLCRRVIFGHEVRGRAAVSALIWHFAFADDHAIIVAKISIKVLKAVFYPHRADSNQILFPTMQL